MTGRKSKTIEIRRSRPQCMITLPGPWLSRWGAGLAGPGIDPVVVPEQSSVVLRSYKLQAGVMHCCKE